MVCSNSVGMNSKAATRQRQRIGIRDCEGHLVLRYQSKELLHQIRVRERMYIIKSKLAQTGRKENQVQTQYLTDEQIQKVAPSAFARQAYSKQSDRYAFVPTSAVIDGMRNAGFFPVKAMQSRTRIEGKQNFTKHLIRFRSSDQAAITVGDS